MISYPYVLTQPFIFFYRYHFTNLTLEIRTFWQLLSITYTHLSNGSRWYLACVHTPFQKRVVIGYSYRDGNARIVPLWRRLQRQWRDEGKLTNIRLQERERGKSPFSFICNLSSQEGDRYLGNKHIYKMDQEKRKKVGRNAVSQIYTKNRFV